MTDRRKEPRPGPRRRSAERAPGKFKEALDTAYRVIRAHGIAQGAREVTR